MCVHIEGGIEVIDTSDFQEVNGVTIKAVTVAGSQRPKHQYELDVSSGTVKKRVVEKLLAKAEINGITVYEFTTKKNVVYISLTVYRGTHPDLVHLWIEKNIDAICKDVLGCDIENDESEEVKKVNKGWFNKFLNKVDQTLSLKPDIDHEIPAVAIDKVFTDKSVVEEVATTDDGLDRAVDYWCNAKVQLKEELSGTREDINRIYTSGLKAEEIYTVERCYLLHSNTMLVLQGRILPFNAVNFKRVFEDGEKTLDEIYELSDDMKAVCDYHDELLERGELDENKFPTCERCGGQRLSTGDCSKCGSTSDQCISTQLYLYHIFPTQGIESINSDKIKEYVALMGNGDDYPAISVSQYLGQYYIIDGHHRVIAANRVKGKTMIKAFVDKLLTEEEAKALRLTKGMIYDFEGLSNQRYSELPKIL